MNPSIITDRVLSEILAERITQDDKWGEQNHPDLSGDATSQCDAREMFNQWADNYRAINAGTYDPRDLDHSLDWTGILLEEVYEAVAEANPAKLRTELVQVAAVAVAWIEAIDRRHPPANGLPPTGHCTKHTGADRQLYGCSGPDPVTEATGGEQR
jgi:hypothetical protein